MSVQVKGSGTIGGLDEGLVVSGIVTSSTQINVGSNIKLGNAGVITATSFVGNITGTATQVSLAAQSADTDCFPVFSLDATGNQALFTKSNRLFFNSSTGALSVTSLNAISKIGVNQTSPYSEVDITSSVEDSTGALSAHGIRLGAVGATDEQVIPITAGFKSQQDRARAGIGFISKISGSSEGYAGAIGFYTRTAADGSALARTDERLRIDSSGRVLIGKTSGDHILDINASNNEIRLTKANASDYNGIQLDRDASGNAGGYFGLAGNTNHYITGSAQHDICIRSESNLVFSSGGATKRLHIASDGTVTVGDGNNLAANYVATMLIDGGDNSKLSIYGSSTGSGTLAFPDGSGTGAQRMAGFIQMNHTSTDNGPRLNMGLNDTTLVHIRVPGSNRGQLEVYGNFNESDAPAIEISDGGDARKAYITNSSGDLNLLTRNGSQTKGQLKMFESGVFFHAQKDPDSTNVLQTFRSQTYRNQTGSTNPSITPDQILIQKGGTGTYDCFYEGNMTLTVNGGGNDHYQPVAFVPLGYDLDTTSFGGQWAGEMWIHQNGSQNPENYGYSGYNNWATMTFKCKWDCAHWNAKPNGFWVEHYLNTGRSQIGKIDASTTMSQFVIYLLPGFYHIRYNCVRGMAVHRSSSNGGSITLQDGGSHATYSTLAHSSRNTAFDSEITSGSASMTHST